MHFADRADRVDSHPVTDYLSAVDPARDALVVTGSLAFHFCSDNCKLTQLCDNTNQCNSLAPVIGREMCHQVGMHARDLMWAAALYSCHLVAVCCCCCAAWPWLDVQHACCLEQEGVLKRSLLQALKPAGQHAHT